MVTVMDWIRAHVTHRAPPELPRDLRDASHRVANESSMIRSEVVQAAGGIDAYHRKSTEIADVARMLRGHPGAH